MFFVWFLAFSIFIYRHTVIIVYTSIKKYKLTSGTKRHNKGVMGKIIFCLCNLQMPECNVLGQAFFMGIFCHKQVNFEFCAQVHLQSSTGERYVEKPAETQTSNQLASSLVAMPKS